jgi:hypothetical protein
MPIFMTQARKVTATPSCPARPDIASAINGGVNIAAFVRGLAAQRGISVTGNALGGFLATLSRVSDGTTAQDETISLLAALYLAGVISNRDNMALHNAYLGQRTG